MTNGHCIFSELKVGSRLELQWEFEERLRAVKVKVLKAPHDDKTPDKKPEEKKPDSPKPEEKKPEEKKPDAPKPEEKKPEEKKP